MFDYIIIGAGSAGCVLAHRLSENPENQVLLIEAGKRDRKREIHVPAAFSRLFKTEYDWNYHTVPQPFAGSRAMYLPRGRVWGGSSSINAMIYIRGSRHDFDGWAAEGNAGWDYDSLLPYFKKSERQQRGSDFYHGDDGLLNVADLRDPFPITKAFVEAGVELGYARNDDFNGEQQEGFGIYQVNQKNGKRFSAAQAFLHPALDRPNLTILTEAPVERIMIEGDQAVGIEVRLPTHLQEYRAAREVILSAGAYNSPQLLMLSGIGEGQQLRDHGLRVKRELPGVGNNLQDHLIVPMVFHNRDRYTLETAEQTTSLMHFLVWGEGPLSSNVAEGGAFVHTREGLVAPDLQFHFAPGYFMNHGFDKPLTGRGFSYGPTLLQPESIGKVSLRSSNPSDAPLIDHHYLEAEMDLRTLMEGMRIGYRLLRTKALGRYFKDFYLPNRKLVQSGELERHIRNTAQTLYHPVGTCKMGSGPDAVVDHELKVHGIKGLRVADASIMPTIVRGNTHAAAVMIGEKAADLILGKGQKNAFPQEEKAVSKTQ